MCVCLRAAEYLPENLLVSNFVIGGCLSKCARLAFNDNVTLAIE